MHVIVDHEQIKKELQRVLGPDYPSRLSWRPEDFQKALRASGYTQAKLAELTGIKQPTISEINTGKTSHRASAQTNEQLHPTKPVDQLIALAMTMGCELGAFADLPQTPRPVITEYEIRELSPRLLEVEWIHTLIKPGEITRLRDIYYRTVLLDNAMLRHGRPSPDAQSQAFQGGSLADFRSTSSIVLGTAGQGKSVFLRYLATQEVVAATSLPLFFELRSWKGEPLLDQLQRKLENFGLCHNPPELNLILEQGRVSLLFDALDELQEDRRQAFLTELTELHEKYPDLKIVMTSRPETGLFSCNWLHPYSIVSLKITDIESLIRIYAEPTEADLIIHQVKEADFDVLELLKTPIFVVLLIIKFRYSHSIPDNIIAFYRDLFDALLRRHNSDESGMAKRLVSSQLHPYLLEKAFRGIAYFVHKSFGDSPPHIREVEGHSEAIASRMAIPSSVAPLIVGDIIRITNLILEEAGHCYFIHKSVREFYAAAHVAETATDQQAATFYSSLLRNWGAWVGVLRFLEHLDRRRYLLHFAIPGLQTYAPFTAGDMVRSFRRIGISKIDDDPPLYNVELDDTDCFEFHNPALLSYGVQMEFEDLALMLGQQEAIEIRKELQTTIEVFRDRDASPQHLPERRWNYTPLIRELSAHLSREDFTQKLVAMMGELQDQAILDADFKIS